MAKMVSNRLDNTGESPAEWGKNAIGRFVPKFEAQGEDGELNQAVGRGDPDEARNEAASGSDGGRVDRDVEKAGGVSGVAGSKKAVKSVTMGPIKVNLR